MAQVGASALVGIAAVAPKPAEAGASDRLRTVAQEFEGMVLAQMLAPMFEALDADGFGGGGSGERMFRPMLVERYAQSLAGNGGIGVADSVYRELVRMQEDAGGVAR
jgi:Rod binding domain-containing protein